MKNRKQRRAQKKKTVTAVFRGGVPDVVRWSNMLNLVRRGGAPQDVLDKLEQARAGAARCPEHGELLDPIVGTMPEARAKALDVPRCDVAPVDGSPLLVFACPDCSGPELRAKWLAEGNIS